MYTIIIILVITTIVTVIYMLMVKKNTVEKINKLKDASVHKAKEQFPAVGPTDDWNAKFQDAGLGHHWEKLQSHLRNQITLMPEVTSESEIGVGQSKIGGQPDLPEQQTWFQENNGKSLSFLAQINLAETRAFDQDGLLPQSGLLYFFYSAEQEAWGFSPDDKDKFKIFYFDGDVTDLRRTEFPTDLPEHARYKSCTLSFASAVSAPSWESDAVRDMLTDAELDTYGEITGVGDMTKLLGHADNIQGTMEEECQLVTHGLYCGDGSGYNDPRAAALKEDADQWRLLFQIDSVEEAGMMWGDVGRVYFWIRKDDLHKKAFDKSWFVLQCS